MNESERKWREERGLQTTVPALRVAGVTLGADYVLTITQWGECLCCGHTMPYVVWKPGKDGQPVGVCGPCRDAAEPLRGHCSDDRGCSCRSAS